MAKLEIVAQVRQPSFPHALDYELTKAGRELLAVAESLERWIAKSPLGPLALGSQAAKGSIKALIDGWSPNLLRALAARPLTLTELDRLISDFNYPSLERRLSAMRCAGQIEPTPSRGPGTPYRVSGWLRRSVAPLTASARWERRHTPHTTAPIGQLDVEATFLLAIPLVRLAPEVSGSCRLTVEMPYEGERRLAGIIVEVDEGRVASYATNLNGRADAWASGSAGAWLQALIESDREELEIGGDCRLAGDLVDALHSDLFGLPEPVAA